MLSFFARRCSLLFLPVFGWLIPVAGLADVRVSLNVFPNDQAQPNAGGFWSLVVAADEVPGVAGLRVLLDRVDDGSIADGDAEDEIFLTNALGAIDPIVTNTGPRRPYLDLGATGTELLFGQDISLPASVTTGVGRPETGGGLDPFGDPAWDDATPIAAGVYPANVPLLLEGDANVLDQLSPPFTATPAPVTLVVRVLPEPTIGLALCLGGAILLAAARRTRDRVTLAPGRVRRRVGIGLAILLATLGSRAPPAEAQTTSNPLDGSAPVAFWSLVLEDVIRIPDSAGTFPRLERLTHDPVTDRAYVIDQRGPIHVFDVTEPTPTATLFLDVASSPGSLLTSNEAGVRDLAFHPDYDDPARPGHRRIYVSFSRTADTLPIGEPVEFPSPFLNHFSVVAEWTLDGDHAIVPGSYRELMRIEQPFSNHNAMALGFDPTAVPGDPAYGLLHISVGDGGSAGDPFDLAQDIDLTPAPYPHGKILRIDPLAADGFPFTVPGDNPFAGRADRIEEVWAFGLRNPHKFTWDARSGRMLVSDIGQGVIEEVSIGRAGANYGWPDREGAFAYVSASTVAPLAPDHPTDPYTYPVAQYDHLGTNGLIGGAATVGGPVYRGSDVPELTGLYFFADFSNNPGPIFAVDVDDLVEREDLTDLETFDEGRLSPFVEVRIRHDGADTTFRTLVRESSGNPSLDRTDLRWGTGPGGELFVLNKRDGWVRRVVDVVGLEGGDANRDGVVDPTDLSIWRTGFGGEGDWSDADFDANGLVDGGDFLRWQAGLP